MKTNDLELFRKCLQFILLWAKKKNILSSPKGFPCSMTYTLMFYIVFYQYGKTVKSCLELLHHFFNYYNQWDFEKNPIDSSFIEKLISWTPILIIHSKHSSSPYKWNQKEEQQKKNKVFLMNVTLPFSNSSFNTCPSLVKGTLKIIKNEFKNAFEHTYQIFNEKDHNNNKNYTQLIIHHYNHLFIYRRPFFCFYPYFFLIKCESSTPKPVEKEIFLKMIVSIRHKMKIALEFFSSFSCISKLEIYEEPITLKMENKKNPTFLFLGFCCKRTDFILVDHLSISFIEKFKNIHLNNFSFSSNFFLSIKDFNRMNPRPYRFIFTPNIIEESNLLIQKMQKIEESKYQQK